MGAPMMPSEVWNAFKTVAGDENSHPPSNCFWVARASNDPELELDAVCVRFILENPGDRECHGKTSRIGNGGR